MAKSEEKEISIEDKKFVTPECRVSFPQFAEAKAFGGGDAKFSFVMLFDKSIDLVKFKQAAKNAAIEKWGAKADAVIAKLKGTKGWPFRDGDKEKAGVKGYENVIFITTKSKSKPNLFNRKKEPILDASEVYAGCYARASLIAYAYDNDFGKGLGFALINVQKLRDGEPFSGRSSGENDFDDLEDDSDDEASYKKEEGADDDMGF